MVRGAVAAGAAVVLAFGLGLLVWAVTPASGSAWSVARGALAALGAANFITPTIGGITVTLAPLLLTIGCAALVASAAVRADESLTAADEAVGALVAGLVYSVVIVATVSALAPSGLTDPAEALAPIVFGAVVGLGAAMLRGKAWRRLLRTAPPALRVGVRAAVGVIAALLAAGALAVGVGLLLDLPTAIELSRQIAPTFGGGLGMMVLGFALLPNAAVAGAGYAGLVGFRFASGSYSPLGTTATELPAMPLLAAMPGAHALAPIALGWLLLPLAAAVAAGIRIRRQLADTADRALAVAVAAAAAGIGTAVLAAIAGGGLVGRQSLVLTVPVGPLAAVVAALVALVAGALCVLPDSGGRSARAAKRAEHAQAAVPAPDSAATEPGADTDTDAPRSEPEPGAADGAARSAGATPDDTAPDDTAPDDTAPDDTAPDEDAPGDGELPAETRTAEVRTDVSSPDETLPDEGGSADRAAVAGPRPHPLDTAH